MAKKTAAVATAEGTGAPAEKKYMKPSEVVTFGIGLFGVALLTGWMPDYTTTFFADFAFKGKGFDAAGFIPIDFFAWAPAKPVCKANQSKADRKSPLDKALRHFASG